jgi:cobalt-zinc-cadmium efflux system protein
LARRELRLLLTEPKTMSDHDHTGGDGHSHLGHSHSHVQVSGDTDTRRLTIALGLIVAFMTAEVVVGIVANSLALALGRRAPAH